MDNKIIDIVCGSVPSLIALKSLDLEHKALLGTTGPDDPYRTCTPLLSGDENNFANLILLNDKADHERMYSGISYAGSAPMLGSGMRAKIFSSDLGSKDNPFNFLSRSLVG